MEEIKKEIFKNFENIINIKEIKITKVLDFILGKKLDKLFLKASCFLRALSIKIDNEKYENEISEFKYYLSQIEDILNTLENNDKIKFKELKIRVKEKKLINYKLYIQRYLKIKKHRILLWK